MQRESNYGRSAPLNFNIKSLKERSSKTSKVEYLRPVKLAFVGLCGVGKTSVIQAFVENSFHQKYDPNFEVKKFITLQELLVDDDDEADSGELVYLVIDDFFGLNNPLLETREEHIKSELLKTKRKSMITKLNDLLRNRPNPPASKQNNEGSQSHPYLKSISSIIQPAEEEEEEIVLNSSGKIYDGVVFVCDLQSENSLKQVEKVIGKMKEIENEQAGMGGFGRDREKKTHMLLLINKTDKKLERKKFLDYKAKALQIVNQKGIDYAFVSSVTFQNIHSSLRRFCSRIYSEFEGRNEVKELLVKQDDEEDSNMNCGEQFSAMANNLFCGCFRPKSDAK